MKKGWLWKILLGLGGAAIAAGGAVFGYQKYKEKTSDDGIQLIDGDAEFPDDPDKVSSGEVADSEE